MRLWPFRRGAGKNQPRGEVATATPTPAPARPAPPRPALPFEHWRRLAPLTRTSGPPPLVAPLRRITSGLAATADTGMVLAPLGHDRRHDAPIGTINGAITPIAKPGTVAPHPRPRPTLDLALTPTPPTTNPIPSRFRAPLRYQNLLGIEDAAPVTPPTAVPAAPAAPMPESTVPPAPRDAVTRRPDAVEARPEFGADTTPTTTPRPADRPDHGRPRADLLPVRRLAAQPRALTAADAPPPAVRGGPLPLGSPAPAVPDPAVPDLAPTPIATPLPAHADPAPSGATRAPVIADERRSPAPDPVPAAGSPPSPTETQSPSPATDPVGELPVVGRRTIHRRRLGEPLAHRPATMVAAPATPSELPTHSAPARPDLPGPHVRGRAAPAPGAARPHPPVARRGALPVALARRAAPVPADEHDLVTPAAIRRREAPASRPSQLVGHRAPLAKQQPRVDDRPAGPVGPPMPVSVVQREQLETPVVPISRSPRRDVQADQPARAPEAVPADLRAQLEPMLGVNLSDVAVHRGPESSRAAAEMRARAFTLGEEVHLPDKLGPTSHGEARATLAHELTHVAQQRRLGAVAPNEDSPAGAAMEAEARNVARRIDGGQRVNVAAPVRHRPTVAMVHSSAATPQHARSGAHRGSSLSPAAASAVTAEVVNAAVRSGLADHMAGSDGTVRGVTFGGTTPTTASSIGAQREPEGSTITAPSSATRVAEAPAAIESLSQERLDELAGRLYEGIRSRLRHDLLVQRERSGSLFDQR